MNEPKATSGEKLRTRRLAIAATVMFLIACGVFGWMFYLQRQADVSSDKSTRRQQVPSLTDAQREARLAKAKLLREKWRHWALQHKDVLKRMLHAQANDQAALMAAYAAIPDHAGYDKQGITGRDLVPSNDLGALAMSGTPFFTWTPGSKTKVRPIINPQYQESYNREKRYAAERLQQNFVVLRDIEIARSIGHGPSGLFLWASGRITESTPVEKAVSVGSIKGSTLVDGPHQEIVPPYDFLK